MLIEQVDELLLNYRNNLARCEFLTHDIPRLEKELGLKIKRMVEASVSLSPNLSGMPHGSSLSDPTGKLGTDIASGYKTEEVKALEEELCEKKKEMENKQYAVSVVDSLLKCLKEKELFVIEKKVIGGMSWNDLRFTYNRHFETTYTVAGLKYMKKLAMEQLYAAAR